MKDQRQRESVTGVRRPASGIDIDAEKLQRMRAERAWTRELLGKRAGLSPSTIASLENGTRRPSIATLGAICEALGCEPVELLTPLGETG